MAQLPPWEVPSENKSTWNAMLKAKRWLVWRSQPNADPTKKPRKVPCYTNGQQRNGALDTPNDTEQLSPYEDALDALATGQYSGLGFALGLDGKKHWQGVDLDDIEDNNLSEVGGILQGYVELSPSGRGLHAIGYGSNLQSLGSNGTGVEFYSSGRYFTVTHEKVKDGPLQDLSPIYPKLQAWHARNTQSLPVSGAPALTPLDERTAADIRSALCSLNAEDRDLWVKVGMGLCSYHQGRGLWEEWSQKSLDKYDPMDSERVWRSFTADGGIDYQSIFHWAKEAGWLNTAKTVQGVSEQNTIALEPMPIGLGLFDALDAIPPRPWVVPNLLLRGYVSGIFAPGGVGKSSMQLVLGMAVGTGKDLAGTGISERTPVLIINNEDDQTEMMRRIGAVAKHYGLEEAELEGNLFVQSGYGSPLMLAVQQDKNVVATPNVEALTGFCKEKNIGVIMIDPFISTHNVGENENTLVDKVVQTYKKLAHETNASVCLVHHTRKIGGNSEAHAGDADIGRGASSLKDAARCIVTLSKMAQETAESINMEPEEAARHMRMDVGKLNFGLDDGHAKWFRMESVQLPSGDWSGVPDPVDLTEAFDAANNCQEVGIKWTPTVICEAIEAVFTKSKSKEFWSLISPQFCEENNISESRAKTLVRLISRDKKRPTRINITGQLIDYWVEKGEHSTSPLAVYRQELSL